MKKLDEYQRKRDFGRTPEPGADVGEPGDLPRFVVQEHHATRLHWDLRLEHDGVLASWAVPNGIPEDPDENRKAVHTEDHPLEYLTFEGDIPEGNYGAGKMSIWDHGTYELHKWEPRKVVLTFHGERLQGRYALFQAGKSEKDWLIHRMDPPVDSAREPMPEHVVPMLARLGDLPAKDSGWAYEIKWDGVRAIAYSEPGRLRLESRNLNDITAQYPEVRPLNRALSSHTAVLDGELVAFDADGRPSFERLQQRMHLTGEAQVRRRAKDYPVVYVVFDLLHLDGHSLMDLPYTERRERLEALGLDGPAWQTPSHNVGGGKRLLDATAKQGLEGIMAKRLDCPYEPGKRASHWIKVKTKQRQELVIGGWLPGEGRRSGELGALLLGYHEDGEFRFAGKVGTGFGEKELRMLAEKLAPLERDTSPFTGKQPQKAARFAEPKLVAEIEFTEWTKDGMLRHPSYKGLRDDKPADAGRGRGAHGQVHEPRQDPVPADRFHQGRADLVLRADGRGDPPPPPRPAGQREAISRTASKARSGGSATIGSTTSRRCSSSPTRRRSSCIRTWLRSDAPERPTTLVFDLDPGPPADIGDVLPGGARPARHAVPARARDVRQDVRRQGAAGVRAAQHRGDLRRDEAVRQGRSRDDGEGHARVGRLTPGEGAARGQGAGRLGPERPRASRRCAPTRCAARSGRRSRCRSNGRSSTIPAALVFEWNDALERVERDGDLFAPVLTLQQKLPAA